MEEGAAVWVRVQQGEGEEWLCGVLRERDESSQHLIVIPANEDHAQIRIPFAAAEDVQAMNKTKTVTVDDMIHLTFLNEPEILHCLELRYEHNLIYTYTGPILISVNPFKVLDIYNVQVLEMYRNYGILQEKGLLESIGMHALPPHLFSIADQLYRKMHNVLINDHTDALNADQIVLISGESGAGKTEATKYILKYLTSISDHSIPNESSTSAMPNIMDKVIQSNPILEAFGNAKTLKNDNSSRFGKFIELHYERRGRMIGGSIQTYLLENSRICVQHRGERNYHVFYQLLAGLSAEELNHWNLQPNSQWRYIHHGEIPEKQSVSDKNNFLELMRAMKTFRLSELKHEIFSLLAGILHLGEIDILDDGDDGSRLDLSGRSLLHVSSSCASLGISEDSLSSLLTRRQLKTKFESICKKLTSSQAVDTRDSLVKTIYKRLFNW